MSKNGEDGSLYDRAYALVDGLIQSYPEGTTFRLLENSFESSVSTKHTATSILNYLTVLKQVGIDRTGEEIVSRKSTEDISGDFYWLSDFDAINGMSGVISDSSSQIKLVPTFSEYPSNIFIDTVYLENTFYSGQFSNNLVVRLASNIKLQETVNLRFSIDGKLLGIAQVAFNNSSNTDYKYKIPEGIGDLSKILIELEASDPVYDNQIYLSVNQLEQVNILEVFQDDSNDYISSLYNENELFEFRRLNIDALQNSFFKQFDFIILNELTSFSNQLVKSITSFVENNCTLLVIPNSEMPLAELARLNILVNEDDNKRIDLESIDFDIPFYEGIFEEEESELNMPDASTKFKINNVEYALLSFENGRPFLSKVSDNNSIYFISSSLKSMYSTLLITPYLFLLCINWL